MIRPLTSILLSLVPVLWLAACAARTSPVSSPAIVQVQLLGFNDFHGTLDPPTGSNGRIGEIAAGGAEFFAAHAARLRAENPNTIMVSAGDNIGASSLLSGMFHDEPTVEALGEAGLQLSTVGNHEFDEGWDELVRMQTGGCHPVDGCQDQTPFAGARYQYLSANVVVDPSRVDPVRLKRSGWRPAGTGPQTLFPRTAVREIAGVKVGFIGLALTSTPTIVQPVMLEGLTFRPEVEAGNEAAAELTAQGVKAIVVLIHAGGRPATADVNACEVTGHIVEVAAGLSPAVDVIVSGHSHRSYVCTLGDKLVTAAESLGRLITDIDLDIDRATGEVVAKRARNVVVTRDVAANAAVTAIMSGYRPFYSTLGNRAVGSITEPLVRKANGAGESPLGDVIADAMLEATAAPANGGASVALWNTGGIRADLVGGTAPQPGAPIPVTYSHAFDVLPFGNRVIVRTVTGAALVQMLETGVFQVSRGLSYTYQAADGRRQRIDPASLSIQGKPIDPAAPVRVTTSDFIWSGGDDVVVNSTDPLDVGADLDLFIEYLGRRSPVSPGPQDRFIRKP